MRCSILMKVVLFSLASAKSYSRFNDPDEGSGEVASNQKFWKLNSQGVLPVCQIRKREGKFVSEVCNIIQPGDVASYQEKASEPTFVFQYCQCPNHRQCSSSFRLDDPYTYAVIGNVHFKTCLADHQLPTCTAGSYSTVAKIWYGEDLPLRVLVHCRCPPRTVWGELKCTSSGRICYVLNCSEIF